MRRSLTVLVATAALAMLTAAGAQANELCYDIDINILGMEVVSEAACEALPI